MNIQIEKSYNVQIWVGLREGYTDKVNTIDDVRKICQEYVKSGDCVTVTPTEFIYTDGNEPGVIIGYINYPRFPQSPAEILEKAKILAMILLEELKQYRITITTPEMSLMIERDGF